MPLPLLLKLRLPQSAALNSRTWWKKGDKKALEIDRLLAEPNIFLSTILVVNSVAVIVASSMATVLRSAFLPEPMEN